MEAIREEDFLKSPLFFSFLQEILPSWYSRCKAGCVSPSSWSMGGHYGLSRVISWGQIQYLTLCSLTSPSPFQTPVLPSQPLTRRWNHWCGTKGRALKENKGPPAAAEWIKWCHVMWERSLSNAWLASILLQSHSPHRFPSTHIYIMAELRSSLLRWRNCDVVILALFKCTDRKES